MKKIFLGLALCILGVFSQAQNGLEKIIVEKYYVSNAADATASDGVLPVGSYTYRFYVDMKPGYSFQMAYGNANHNLIFHTSTGFFNNEDYGATTPNGISVTHAKSNTVMLDSWLSAGGAATGKFGVLKTSDTDGSIGNSNGLLQNTDPKAGIPIKTEDGMMPATGALPSITMLGLDAVIGVLDGTSNAGNDFTVNNGAWSVLGGVQGLDTTNRVLIAQITTDGMLHYELNIQIGTPDGGTQNYVASNPVMYNGQMELTLPSLSGNLNVAPTISITSPVNKSHTITGDVVPVTTIAADADGYVAQVQFFIDGVSQGILTAAPYTINYTGVTGTHVLSAIATDNDGLTKTSANDTLYVAPNQPPTVSITTPSNSSSSVVGDAVSIAANASDIDGTVASVEFFVDNVSLGVKTSAPYTASYVGVLGTHSLTAKATDNRGATTMSAPVSISVVNNTPPTVSIISPSNGQNININTAITITANAADIDGTVASVQFYENGVSVGTVTSAPYQVSWTPAVEGSVAITAVATDNKGATTTSSPIAINIVDPNALPYQVNQVVQKCTSSSVCMPVVSTKANMSGVIGYDVVMNYNKNKVTPTGIITVSNDLITASYTNYMTNIDTANSLMNISIYFNSNAPQGTTFHGAGQLFCAQFNKTAQFNSVDTAIFSISTLNESYTTGVSTKLVKSGKFITYKDSIFNGHLEYWSDNNPIKYDVAHPNNHLITNIFGCGKTTNAVQPDTLGNFTYIILNGTTINLSRDILNTTDVQSIINSNDAFWTAVVNVNAEKQHNNWTPSIFQMIAMDVNRDGQISAGDASQINQRGVGIIAEFAQVSGPSRDWLFVSNDTLTANAYKISSTFPSNDGIGYSKYKVPVVSLCQGVPVVDAQNCPSISQGSYTGILLGDVDASYASIPSSGLLRSTNEIVMDLSKVINLGNGEIEIPVSLTSDTVINSFDFNITLNNQNETFDSVDNLNGLQVNWNTPTNNTLKVGAYSLNPIPSQNAIKLTLTTNNQVKSSDFSSTLALINGQNVNFSIVDITTGLLDNSNQGVVRVYPNPTSDKLNIEVSENSKIQMFDLNGKQVISETTVNGYQKQIIDVNNLANGIYMLKVYNDNFVKMQKVVINK